VEAALLREPVEEEVDAILGLLISDQDLANTWKVLVDELDKGLFGL
jgi:hypothetical protein